jgi:hypothetical protein
MTAMQMMSGIRRSIASEEMSLRSFQSSVVRGLDGFRARGPVTGMSSELLFVLTSAHYTPHL